MSKKRRHKPKAKKHSEPTEQEKPSAEEELHQVPPTPQRHLTTREIREIYNKARAGRGVSEEFWNFHKIFTAATIGLIIIILVIGIMIIFGGIKVSRELNSQEGEQEDNSWGNLTPGEY